LRDTVNHDEVARRDLTPGRRRRKVYSKLTQRRRRKEKERGFQSWRRRTKRFTQRLEADAEMASDVHSF
jgi:hypothetical protein